MGGVKTSLAATRRELQKTIADLKSARGDLGVQSGLIATNAKELAALRRLGERNYFEFKLGKDKEPQRVGDITDPAQEHRPQEEQVHRRRDGRRQAHRKEGQEHQRAGAVLHQQGAKQPYELVVNKVQKDMIVGYLSTPKEQASR